MWILLFKTVLKSHVIKPAVVRECIKERLLTLSTAVTGPNPWEENSEFSMQKVCWRLFLDQQLEGREEYRWGRGALLLVTRETLQVLRSSGAEAALVKGSKPLPPCYLQILHAQCPWKGAWHRKRWRPFTEGSIQRDKLRCECLASGERVYRPEVKGWQELLKYLPECTAWDAQIHFPGSLKTFGGILFQMRLLG